MMETINDQKANQQERTITKCILHLYDNLQTEPITGQLSWKDWHFLFLKRGAKFENSPKSDPSLILGNSIF